MRILLIHQAFAAQWEPGGTRHFDIMQSLARKGHEIFVITAADNYLTGKIEKNIPKGYEEIKGLSIIKVKTFFPRHKNWVTRILSFITFALGAFISSLRIKQINCVFATSPPNFQVLPAWLMAKIKRCPFVLEIRDLWPRFAVDLGLLRNRLLIYLAYKFENFFCKQADVIVVNSPGYISYFEGKKIPKSKIKCIPNGVNCRDFEIRKKKFNFRNQYQLENKLIVMYAGALGLANNLGILLEAAERLKKHKDIAFVIVGEGKEKGFLKQMMQSKKLDNVVFSGAYPKKQMPEILAQSDICMALLKDSPSFNMPYPNKVFDYLASKKPVILGIKGAIADLIAKAEAGICVMPESSKEIADAVIVLKENEQLRRSMGLSGYEYVKKYCDRSIQVSQFEELMRSIDEKLVR